MKFSVFFTLATHLSSEEWLAAATLHSTGLDLVVKPFVMGTVFVYLLLTLSIDVDSPAG